MGDLRERLRRFGGVVAAEPDPPRPSEDLTAPPLRDALRRRANRLTRQASESPAESAAPAAIAASTGPPRELDVVDHPEGASLVRTRTYPATPEALRSLGSSQEVLTWFSRDRRLSGLDVTRSVFLDTETTSLSGGAGVHVFLVALGWLSPEGEFTLRQYFLPSLSQERSMLAAVARELARARGVITFFGKSFDRHRLEDKFRLHGLDSHFPSDLHADLYHIARARFGWRLVNGKLRTLEEEVLGVRRSNDLPGSEAPAAYFDYLAGKPHRLEAVFEHNALDVHSLIALHAACASPVNTDLHEECLAAAKGAATVGDLALARSLAANARVRLTGGPAWTKATRQLLEFSRSAGDRHAWENHLRELAGAGCPESALGLASLVWKRDRNAERVAELLRQVQDGAGPLPPGKLRDAILLGAARLRRSVESVQT